MKAMVLERPGTPLVRTERPDPLPGPGEVRLKVEACAVCRTDLHVVDGELDQPKHRSCPGMRSSVLSMRRGLGRRVGLPWLGHTCGTCAYCRSGAENLCDEPSFIGYTRDGGFASHVVADADFAFDLDQEADPVTLAPLLYAGLIGWRSLKRAGEGRLIGLYGFGAAAHIIAQVYAWQGREVYAFTRPGDTDAQHFAASLGAVWTGGSDETPPVVLDTVIIFAPVGALVPTALRAVRKGGRVVCGGIHMSDIPTMSYSLLWGARELVSVANLTSRDAQEFFPVARAAKVRTHTTTYSLDRANEAIADLRSGSLSGAAVLVP